MANFRKWLENVTEPEKVAKHWQQNLPEENDLINEDAVADFVHKMADDSLNGQALAMDMIKRVVVEPRYEKQIQNNLLRSIDERLGTAYGTVTNKDKPLFAFFMKGKEEGNLIIQHPPLVYDDDDRLLLTSIVRHETGHALDWLNPAFQGVEPSGDYTWNAQKYIENLYEARRYADQLRYLLRRLNGDVERVLGVLKGQKATPEKFLSLRSKLQDANPEEEKNVNNQINHLFTSPKSPMAFHPHLIPVAKVFLQTFENKNENWLAKAVGPLMVGASTLMPGTSQVTPLRNQMVIEEQSSKEAAECVSQIFGLMRLKNFVYKA